jgi:hypothetical protein
MSIIKPAFDSVRLGNDRTGFTVQLLPFPRCDAPLLEKVQAFAYFEEVIRQHRSQLTASVVQQAYADNIPVSSSASASEESTRIGLQLYDSFFCIEHLQCLGFYKSDGVEVPVALDPCDRSSDISFIQFEATIVPASFSSALLDTPTSVVQYFLKLPQSLPPPKPVQSPPHDDTLAARDTDDAEAHPSSPETLGMTTVRQLFKTDGSVSDLNLADPQIIKALTSIINISTADKEIDAMFTPGSTQRQLFPDHRSAPATSPGIRRYLADASSIVLPTFCGPLNFLDSQALFDSVFPVTNRKPIIALRLPTPNSSISTLGTDEVDTAMQTCLSECRMLVFIAMIRLDYIGHHNIGSADHLQMTVKRIRNLSLKFNVRGVAVDGNPDMLFDKYLALIPLLPATHVNIWGINLFSQFWSSLGDDLTRRIAQLPRYVAIHQSIFDLTTMSTKARQMTALRELRSLAVESWNALQDDKRNMRAMFRELSSSGRASNHFTESSTNVSSAEATMQRYSSDDLPSSSAVQTYYQHPSPAPSGPASDFAPDFRGCLGCGGAEHVFRSCPMKSDPATIERFHRNFNIKFNRPGRPPERSSRRDRDSSYGPSTTFQPPPGSPPAFGQAMIPGAGRGAHRNQPAWLSHQHHSRTSPVPPVHPDPETRPSPPKMPRNYPLFVRSCQQQVAASPPLRPMPIRVDNGLPHLRLHLGLSSAATLSVLFDSGAALSSGYLPYHLQIMRDHPEIVAGFERFDDSNPFEPIKLGGAIRHPDDYNESTHGQLTAIIRYKTPYVDHDGHPIRISFGLGNDMTVNTILGMPIIKDLGMIPNFRARSVICEDSPATFDIRYHETCCGFLADDGTAAPFSALPIADLYPSILSSAIPPAEPSSDPCIDATDDHTQGFLQRNLN